MQHAARPIRCYKIGNGRRSYNKVELHLTDGCGRTAAIQQCIHVPATNAEALLQESSIEFHVVLPGRILVCRLFLVYDVPQLAGETDAASVGGEGSSAALCSWRTVSRADCTRGCNPNRPLLATSRRLSGLGKRQLEGTGDAKTADGVQGAAARAAQQMFVSIDEACTHCGASAFRLVAAIYAQAAQPLAAPSSSGEQGTSGAAAAAERQQGVEQQSVEQQAEASAPQQPAERLLAAAVSPLIKVLANNDTPTGPGHIPLEVTLPADWEGWQDPTVWCTNRESLESSSALLPGSGTSPQPRRLGRSSRSESCVAAAADCGSAGSKPGSPPAVVATAVSQPPLAAPGPARAAWPGGVPDVLQLPPKWQLPPQLSAAACLRNSTPVLMAPQAQPVMPVGTAGAAGAARQGSWALQGRPLPSAEAAEAAVAAAWRQRQQARQAATAESPLQPRSPLQGGEFAPQPCGPAAAAHMTSHGWAGTAALPPLVQPPATAAGPLVGAEAMLAPNGRAIVTRVPGGYRVVRVAGAPAASPSPFALRRSAQGPTASSDSVAAASYGSAAAASLGSGVPVLAGQSAPADCASMQWSASAPRLPRARTPPPASFAWAQQQPSSGSRQQGTQLLPPDAYDVAAVDAALGPPLAAAPAWPVQQPSMPQQVAPPPPAAASLASSSTAVDPGSWGAMQWAVYQSAMVRQVDLQLVTAGLAAAGRLGLLPSAARQQAPASSQPAWHSAPAAQDGHRQAPGPAAGAATAGQHGMPDLPSEAQLLSLMSGDPSEFDSMGSIFDDVLPHEPRT